MNILFAFYNSKAGYNVLGFSPFDAQGKSAFDQAKEYAAKFYDEPDEPAKIYLLTEIPVIKTIAQMALQQ